MSAELNSAFENDIGAAGPTSRRRRSPLQPGRPSTEYALLGLLMNGPGHGYDLTQQFSASSELGKVCRLEMSMLYALLKKLEREGLLTSHEEAVSDNKTRRVVALTEAGRREFENWLTQPVRHTREIRLDFLVKLYFARQRDPALARRLLEGQIAFTQKILGQLSLQEEAAAQPPTPFEKWVLEFRRQQSQAVLNWLNQCRQDTMMEQK